MATENSNKKPTGTRVRFALLLGLSVAFAIVVVVAGIKWVAKNQVLSAVAVQKSDLRTMRTVLNDYRVDTGEYPENMKRLTTPVAYIPELIRDVFNTDGEARYYLHPSAGEAEAQWVIWSVGPDGLTDLDAHLLEKRLSETDLPTSEALEIFRYDVTNGTLSEGDVFFTDQDLNDNARISKEN